MSAPPSTSCGKPPQRRSRSGWYTRPGPGGRYSNDLFESGRTFCITTYQALFNGLSSIRRNHFPGAVLFDDAHVAEAMLRDDAMWGTDLTSTLTGEGQAAIFVTVDHCSTECIGIHAARRATRFEALEPIRQGVRAGFGAFAEGIANGLKLRHNHGSQYVAHDFQAELAFLGIAPSPAFVREPEGNGCAERFIRTLKENRKTCSGCGASPPSRSCARRSTPSRTPTTGPGSSSATATRPPLPSEQRSSTRSQSRHEPATRCLKTVDRFTVHQATGTTQVPASSLSNSSLMFSGVGSREP
jgi:transposase InsO family protein